MNQEKPSLVDSIFNVSMAELGCFEGSPELAVAVSGGSDSMALVLLANEWVKERGGRVVALSVDHKLREDSLFEVRQVQAWMSDHKIEHHILDWSKKKKNWYSRRSKESPIPINGVMV